MIRAAGILLVSTKGNALFLKRGPGGDYPDTWCVPGGRVEDGEDVIGAAIRETLEEAGYKAKEKNLTYLTRSIASSPGTSALAPAPEQAMTPQTLGDAIHNAATASPPADPIAPDQVDFTTFIEKDVEEFTPILCDEHTGYAWAPLGSPPQPLHPGCAIALRRAGNMNELEVAQAIRDGELSSPQRYEKFTLFAIRITGTEYAYRSRKLGAKATKDDIKKGTKVDTLSGKLIERDAEYVYRDPSFYLNDEFLARCNGLPVVLEHPEGMMVDSEEFANRGIGTVFLPYIVGTEVWAIAKIYDDKAASMMESQTLSTSPGVVWHEAPGSMSEVDGHKFLIEGKPGLLDHIAICWQGVWDKGGDPVGVTATRGDSDMTAEELKKMMDDARAEDAKKLAGLSEGMTALGTTLGRLATRMDEDDIKKEEAARADARGRADNFKFGERKDGESNEDFKERMDTEEKVYCDALEEAGEINAKKKAADSRKDAEDESEKKLADTEDEEKNEKARADAAAALGLGIDIKKQLETLQALVANQTRQPDADIASYGRVQARADAVYAAMGGNAPRPGPGESLIDYRKRIIVDLKPHSKRWKEAEISVAAVDEGIFAGIESQVLEDALKSASDPAKVPAGRLQKVSVRLDSGHNETKWIGEPISWMRSFMPPLQAGSFEGTKPGSNR